MKPAPAPAGAPPDQGERLPWWTLAPGRPALRVLLLRVPGRDRRGRVLPWIEQRYGVSDESARHHTTECVPEDLARAADGRAAAEAQTVDTVLKEESRLLTEARDALAAAMADGEASHKDRATWFRELRQTVELLASSGPSWSRPPTTT